MDVKIGVLMELSGNQTDQIEHEDMSEEDVRVSADLYLVLSLSTEGEALEIVRNSPANNGCEAWRRMVRRWEPRVPARFQGMLQAILF